MLGNRLLNFIKENKNGKYNSASKADVDYYNNVINDFYSNQNARGKNFDTKKWADDFGGLSSDVVDFFSNVQEGDDVLEGLANTMGKTTNVISSSGEAFVSSGSKIKDFGKKAKDGISTFGKSIRTGLKGGLKTIASGLFGGALNVGINLIIGQLISSAISAWQNYSNAQENAIAKSSEAVSKLQANQNKIKSAEEVLSNIKENKVIDSSGNEATFLEQLSQGVNSLKEMNNWVDAGID